MSPIKTYVEDGILHVTLDRPKANAIDLATSKIMGETFAAFRDDPSLRVAIITGAGDKFFCPGWDLKAAAEILIGRHKHRVRRALIRVRPRSAVAAGPYVQTVCEGRGHKLYAVGNCLVHPNPFP